MKDSGGWGDGGAATLRGGQAQTSLGNHLPGPRLRHRETHSVWPRQKDSMLCGAKAQLTRIFSSRSAVRT